MKKIEIFVSIMMSINKTVKPFSVQDDKKNDKTGMIEIKRH